MVTSVAEIHTGASLSPSKVELVSGWMGDQRWYAAKGQQPRLRRLASWRLDDPEGEVGVETIIVADEAGAETVVYQVPLTYRGEPLGSADHALVGTMEHSVLGHRWVYDAPHDPVYAAQLLELVQGRVRAASSTATGAVDESVVGVPQPSWGNEVHVRTSRVLSYARVDRRERDSEDRSALAVLCVNNLSSRPQSTTITLPEELWDWETRDLFGGSGFPDIAADGTITITLGSRDFFWLALVPRRGDSRG